MSDKEESISTGKHEFKMPVLIGRVGKLPKKAKSEPEKVLEEIPEEKPVETPVESNPKSSLPPAVLLKELSTPIPYKEPKWSGLCPDGSDYALEVLKSGMIVEKIPLTTKPYYVFGRLANCDVVLAHPTISRFHCVLQYKAFAEESEPASGWYIYELGSTHGTFLNKERLKPAHYVRVRVGHQIKFGNSTRTYIMLGPHFDSEGESELTVTEIKQKAEEMRLERDRMIREAKEQREKERLEEERRKEEQGIDWGLGEDAEEEPDLADNPYAVTTNEELYLTDPKKTLRGYMEREGHELNYDCEERGHGQFICRVELPLDDARGRPVIAEAIHTGKKKDAVIACALEACRILDRAGLLRQAKHESRRRKKRDWSADDYYDSDDDTFLDRTGQVEKKRKQRMEQQHVLERDDKPKTYDDLLQQIKEIEAKITSEEAALERLRNTNKTNKQTDSETDSLDEYMNTLTSGGQSMATKAEISKTKMSIQKLKTELSKTQRLADIARPAHLPPLIKKDDKQTIKINNTTVYGKRIKLKTDTIKRPKPQQRSEQNEEFVEEMDSDEDTEESNQKETKVQNTYRASETETQVQDEQSDLKTHKQDQSTSSSENNDLTKDKKHTTTPTSKSKQNDLKTVSSSEQNDLNSDSKQNSENIVLSENAEAKKKTYGPMRPPENYVIPEDYFNQESDRDLPEIMEDE